MTEQHGDYEIAKHDFRDIKKQWSLDWCDPATKRVHSLGWFYSRGGAENAMWIHRNERLAA